MLNVNKLLKKKHWTGEDLGRLELVNTLDAFRQSLEGVAEPKDIISRTDLLKMIKTLKDPEDIATYNGYISIHEWFRRTYGNALAHEQEACLNYNILLFWISNAQSGEEVYNYIEKLPLILTDKQYEDSVAQHKEETLHPADPEDKGLNIFEMINDFIGYYVNQLEKSPRKKNPLKPIKKTLEKELVTDPRILDRYNKVMSWGYYELKDGTRSDKVTEEEWEDALENNKEPISPEAWERIQHKEPELTYFKSIYNGASYREADKAQYDLETELGLHCEQEWHYYDNPPEDLNKWEIIEAGDLGEYYPAFYGQGTEKEQLEDIKTFKRDFPELTEAALKDMEKYIKGISSIPVEKWLTTVYSWEELYNMGFYFYDMDSLKDDNEIFEGNYRAVRNGIAILKTDSTVPFWRDEIIDSETGYYKAPDITKPLATFALNSLFTDSENYADNLDQVEDARYCLYRDYYYLKGYNLALDLIAQKYKLEELEVGKISMDMLNKRIESYNGMVYVLYSRIKHTQYEDTELKEKKLQVLQNILYPLDVSDIEIPEEAIAKAKADLKDFKAFKDDSCDLISTLCVMRRN